MYDTYTYNIICGRNEILNTSDGSYDVTYYDATEPVFEYVFRDIQCTDRRYCIDQMLPAGVAMHICIVCTWLA